MKLTQLTDTGGSRTGTLRATLAQIVEKVGPPHLADDPDKVDASWGFTDGTREAWIWSYKQRAATAKTFSIDGNKTLLADLFGKENVHD